MIIVLLDAFFLTLVLIALLNNHAPDFQIVALTGFGISVVNQFAVVYTQDVLGLWIWPAMLLANGFVLMALLRLTLMQAAITTAAFFAYRLTLGFVIIPWLFPSLVTISN